jgi:hypothetical protein
LPDAKPPFPSASVVTKRIGGKLVRFEQEGHNAIIVPSNGAEAMKQIEQVLHTRPGGNTEPSRPDCLAEDAVVYEPVSFNWIA